MNIFNIVIAAIIPTCAVLILILWFISIHINKKYTHYIMNERNSVRTFIIDKNKNRVKFFNTFDLRNIKEMSLEEFYVQFSKEDTARLDNWLNASLRKTSKVDPYLEIEVFMSGNKKKYFSVFKLTNVDKEKRIIHVDSYLFLHLSTRTEHGYKLNDISLEDAIKKLKVTPSHKGATYNFKFHFVNKINQEVESNKLVFTQLKEIALFYAYPPRRYLIEITDNDFAIIDYGKSDNEQIMNFVHRLVKTMRTFLEINGILENVQFSIGVVANKHFPSNAKKLILKAQEMSELAYTKNVLLIAYTKNNLNSEDSASSVDQIIKDKKLNFTFSPIVDLKNGKVRAYILNTNIKNSSIKNIEELYDHARRSNEVEKLLTYITKESSSLFTSLKDSDDTSLILFRDLKFDDIPVLLNNIKKSSTKEGRYVAMFGEYDVSYYSSKHDDFANQIEKLRSKGVSSCLKLSDKSLILDSKVYSQFDYFNIEVDLRDFRKTTIMRLPYRIIAEKLVKYNRPIIVSKADGWGIIEILVRSGISYASSSVVAPSSDILITPSIKSVIRLKKINQ